MELILDKFVNKNVMPAYFIGAGISRRYLDGYPNWEELLKALADKLQITDLQYSSILQIASDTYHDNRCKKNAHIASTLKKMMIERSLSDKHYTDNFFSAEDRKLITKTLVDQFTYLVSKMFIKCSVSNRKFKKRELMLLKKVLSNASVVITTNYDTFIEEELLNNEFQTFCNQSSYFMPESYGYGEIYKIHGTLAEPTSLIITSEDYENYHNQSIFSSAKIISILCEHPLIFMGYSLDDENIKTLIHKVIDCLSAEDIKRFEKNLIMVKRTENMIDIVQSTSSFEHKGKTINYTTLETDNFLRLYTILSRINPAFKSTTLRKMNKMYKKAIFSTAPKDYITVNVSELNNLESDKFVISFTQEENLGGLPKSKIYIEALNETNNYNAEKVLSECKWACTEYFPIYYFVNKTHKKTENALLMESDRLKNTSANHDKHFQALKNLKTDIINNTTAYDYINTPDIKTSRVLPTLMSNYYNNKISQATYKKCLKSMLDNDNNLINDSNMKKAICLIHYKKFKGI